jgi:NADH:ubiquinone oxidoreductase subunit 6 (subunit J)
LKAVFNNYFLRPVQSPVSVAYNWTMQHDAVYAVLDLIATGFSVAAFAAVALTGFLRD